MAEGLLAGAAGQVRDAGVVQQVRGRRGHVPVHGQRALRLRHGLERRQVGLDEVRAVRAWVGGWMGGLASGRRRPRDTSTAAAAQEPGRFVWGGWLAVWPARVGRRRLRGLWIGAQGLLREARSRRGLKALAGGG